MKFTDKIERALDEEVYLIRKISEAEKKGDIEIIRELPQTQGKCFCKTIIKNVELNEAIFTRDGVYITYRIE